MERSREHLDQSLAEAVGALVTRAYQSPGATAPIRRWWLQRLWITRRARTVPRWEDTESPIRPGWRTRAAIIPGALVDRIEDEEAFAVDYQVCRRCRTGWVEQPATLERYKRRGLARAGLATLRADHPGNEWHTLSGHGLAREFWDSVTNDAPGAYSQRDACRHIPGEG